MFFDSQKQQHPIRSDLWMLILHYLLPSLVIEITESLCIPIKFVLKTMILSFLWFSINSNFLNIQERISIKNIGQKSRPTYLHICIVTGSVYQAFNYIRFRVFQHFGNHCNLVKCWFKNQWENCWKMSKSSKTQNWKLQRSLSKFCH